MRNSFANSHPGSKLIFALFIILSSFLLTFLIGFLLAIPIFKVNLSELNSVLSDYSDPGNLKFLKYLQTIQSIGLFIVPAFVIGYLFNKKSIHYLKLNIRATPVTIVLCVLIFLSAIPMISALAHWNQNMHFPEWMSGIENWMIEKEESAKKLTESLLVMNSFGSFIFNLFMIAVLPAVGEELIFRGVFQRIFTEWTKNIHVGIIIAAILFSSMHIQFYGFIPRLVLGMLLGYLFYWSKSIWVPIIGHFVNNGAAVTFYYFYKDEISSNVDSFGVNQDSYYALIISALVVGLALLLLYRENKENAIT